MFLVSWGQLWTRSGESPRARVEDPAGPIPGRVRAGTPAASCCGCRSIEGFLELPTNRRLFLDEACGGVGAKPPPESTRRFGHRRCVTDGTCARPCGPREDPSSDRRGGRSPFGVGLFIDAARVSSATRALKPPLTPPDTAKRTAPIPEVALRVADCRERGMEEHPHMEATRSGSCARPAQLGLW
jgi:hypothetical protein